MPRVKRGNVRTKKRRAVLSQTKGYMWGRKNLIKQAKTAINKAGAFAFRDRRAKKRVRRGLWQVQLGVAAKNHDLSYSKIIHLFKSKNIALDRKVLADLAANQPALFTKMIELIG